jgi:hypothetical protein
MLQDQEYKAYMPVEPTLGDMSLDTESLYANHARL